jgi:hypothetical protein
MPMQNFEMFCCWPTSVVSPMLQKLAVDFGSTFKGR